MAKFFTYLTPPIRDYIIWNIYEPIYPFAQVVR
jgi:hypothetical protein